MVAVGALILAWLLDAAFGEPRNARHPVAWLGRGLSVVGRSLPASPAAIAFVAGALLWLAVIAAVAALAWWLQRALQALPVWAAAPLLALLLKPSFAWRMLQQEVAAVEAAFASGLSAARERVARLCSRDTSALDAAAVRETAIETLAENLVDSLVAPLFWFVVAGLPGAWVWRAANTMDAMWGYRGRWEWAGKCAARADDVLAWLPARLTALLLWRRGIAPATLRREAARTPSPNGGWPMAAMALRLGVRLSKPRVYVLNAPGRAADAAALARALRIAGRAAHVALAATLGALLLREAL